MMSVRKQLAVLLAIAVLPASVSALVYWERGKWDAFRDHTVSFAEVVQWRDRVLWVDARLESDFLKGHVPDALRLTEDDWNELLPDLLKAWYPECVVMVYCNSRKCHASEEVAKRLRGEVGLEPVYVLRGGWEAWKRAQE